MAGSRERHGRARRVDASPERQRAWFDKRLREAKTPRGRVSAAYDYLRMRMSGADQAVQVQAAEQVVRLLVTIADQIIPRDGAS